MIPAITPAIKEIAFLLDSDSKDLDSESLLVTRFAYSDSVSVALAVATFEGIEVSSLVI